MENFKRLNKNSKIVVMDVITNSCTDVAKKILEHENDETMILQVINMGGVYIAEYISKLEDDIEDEPKSRHDVDFENYLDTIINKDPFGGKYSGMKIRTVFEQGDEQWLRIALEQMKNEFIRDRLQYILDRGGYGKIINK